ncbi:MAG: dienelactone hydrolase family protein [Proteobacteria bacterium]|nr:dienelactone hydrolase family protein [Pseudomonadota bacterium]MDA0845574.1 dienelactone hydrolase family protein [Pseudomonadota bacterium]
MKHLSLHIVSLCAALLLGTPVSLAAGEATTLTYQLGDKTFAAHVETAASPAKGTVFIIHDWDGLTDYEKSRAKMLSDLGFDAIAVDLFGVDAKLENRDDYKRETGALYKDRTQFRARIAAAIDAGVNSARNREKIVIIGYCFGGAATLEAARAGLRADGFVSFHGGLKTPDGQDYSQTTAPVLVLHGSADPVSGMEDVAALINQLKDANVPHDAQIFGGARHSFTVQGSRDYDAQADQKSWDALQRFLAKL